MVTHPVVDGAAQRPQFDLGELEVGSRRSRLPEMALGLLLIVGSALGALAWQTFDNNSRLVLAASEPVAQGDVVTREHLELVEFSTEESLNVLDESGIELVVGQVAQVDITTGTLITANLVGDSRELNPGRAEVGVDLELGSLPPRAKTPGAVVDVVLVPAGTSGEVDLFDVEDAVLVSQAVVGDVVVEGSLARLSLSVDADDATRIARAAALNRVRLIAVAPADINADGADRADADVAGSDDVEAGS